MTGASSLIATGCIPRYRENLAGFRGKCLWKKKTQKEKRHGREIPWDLDPMMNRSKKSLGLSELGRASPGVGASVSEGERKGVEREALRIAEKRNQLMGMTPAE